MGNQVKYISKTVTTAATRVQLVAPGTATLPCQAIYLQAKAGNTGKIFVGDETVASGSGLELIIPTATKNDWYKIDSGDGTDSLEPQNIWLDSAVNGEGVNAVLIRK